MSARVDTYRNSRYFMSARLVAARGAMELGVAKTKNAPVRRDDVVTVTGRRADDAGYRWLVSHVTVWPRIAGRPERTISTHRPQPVAGRRRCSPDYDLFR